MSLEYQGIEVVDAEDGAGLTATAAEVGSAAKVSQPGTTTEPRTVRNGEPIAAAP